MPTSPGSLGPRVLPSFVRQGCTCVHCTGFRRLLDTVTNDPDLNVPFLRGTVRRTSPLAVNQALDIILSEQFDAAKYDATLRRVNISSDVKTALISLASRYFPDMQEFRTIRESICHCCNARHASQRPPASLLLEANDLTDELCDHLDDLEVRFCDRCWSAGGITLCRECLRFGFSYLFDPGEFDGENSEVIFPHPVGGYGSIGRCTDCTNGTRSRLYDGVSDRMANNADGATAQPVDYVMCAGCDIQMAPGSPTWMYGRELVGGTRLCHECGGTRTYHRECNCCALSWPYSTDMVFYNGLGSVCPRCQENLDIRHCDDCDQSFVVHEEPGLCSCNYYEINNYTYRPVPHYLFDQKRERREKSTYYGIELEFSPPSGRGDDNSRVLGFAFKRVPRMFDYFYAKQDVSTNNGFEIVSHPFTWNWIEQKEQKEMLYNFFKILVGQFGYSGRNVHCGMHIHVSRKWFRASTMYKITKMFYGYPLFAEKVAGRSILDMQRYASLSFGGKEDLTLKAKNHKRVGYGDRGAINLLNQSTVEFRLFRGVDDADVMYRNLEYLEALRQYVALSSLEDANPFKFKDWILSGDMDNAPLNKKYSRVANHLRNFSL